MNEQATRYHAVKRYAMTPLIAVSWLRAYRAAILTVGQIDE